MLPHHGQATYAVIDSTQEVRAGLHRLLNYHYQPGAYLVQVHLIQRPRCCLFRHTHPTMELRSVQAHC